MTRRMTFYTASEHQRNVDTWPSCDTSQLDATELQQFDRRAKALRHYLTRGRLKEASLIAQCSRSTLLDLLTRCLTVNDDGRIFGFRALLLHLRTKEYARTKPLPEGRVERSGEASGAFRAFLRAHPDIHRHLDQCIQRGGTTSLVSRKPRSADVYRTFVMLCRSRIAPDSYPLNSRSGARRSVERYVRAYLDGHLSCVETWYGADAAQRLRLGTGKKSFRLGEAPFDVVGFDAHKIHCIGTVELPGPVGPQQVAIERLWLNAVVDSGCSNAVIGYSISIAKEISATHVEKAIKSCVTAWHPRPLKSPQLFYREGAGLPVGTVPGLTGCRFAKLKMDNALQHFAGRIVERMRRSMGCSISWGQVGSWWRNTEVERLFLTLERSGFQRLPSSTGSNVQDPLPRDPVGAALKNRITWEDLLDLADVFIANYNAKPQDALGGQSPLQVLNNYLDPGSTIFVSRPGVPLTAFTPRLGVVTEARQVRGALIHGRRPYVEIDQIRYSGQTFSTRFDLVGAAVIVRIDEWDMREVNVYLEDGTMIDTLRPLNSRWSERKFDRDTVKAVNAHARNADNADFEEDDPLNSYYGALIQKASLAAQQKPHKVSREATQLAAAAFVSGSPVSELVTRMQRRPRSTPPRPLPASMSEPSWDEEPGP